MTVHCLRIYLDDIILCQYLLNFLFLFLFPIQTIGIPMGTNCAPLISYVFLFCYERDFMKSRENQCDLIEAFNSTSNTLMIY